jgi:hypothetical protein
MIREKCRTNWALCLLLSELCIAFTSTGFADEKSAAIVARPGLFQALTEPPCSYCSTQNRKKLIDSDDRVVAWIRGAHNGGAVPIRHFLSAPRVINDTYGLFFYDPDGGYTAAYQKDYGYEFYGWRRGVMMIRGRDGTIWSALTGAAVDGPRKGQRLERIPSMVTDWSYWLMLHPESTAYDLFDGERYPVHALPTTMSKEVLETMGEVDGRLKPFSDVLGVEVGDARKAYPLEDATERACYVDEVAGKRIAVLWYAPTRTANCFRGELGGQKLTFYADSVSPESAPFKDRETGTRWTLAGRGIDGPLKGRELDWVTSIQCRWYAWSAENPATDLYVNKTTP